MTTGAWIRRRSSLARRAALLVAALAAWAAGPAAARADRIDDKLIGMTMQLIDHAKENKAKTVGVLKFRASRDGGKETFHLGPINNVLADRLENTLVLGYNAEPDWPINVVHDASARAARERLSYLPAGKAADLFRLKYPLAGSKKTATPDLFLTGHVDFDSKAHTTTVVIQSFTRDRPELREVARFTVPTERATLAEAGRSFVIKRAIANRDAGPDKDDPADDAADADAAAREKAAAAPQGGAEPPPAVKPAAAATERLVDLQVRYNGEPVALEPDARDPANRAFTRDPKAGDAVTLVLTNRATGPDAPRVAVALLVNGVNTINEETDEPRYCTKWVLEPGKELVIDGFYVGDTGKDNVKPFKVLSDEESDALFSRNAAGDLSDERLGTISLHVFAEGQKAPAGEAAVTRGLAPSRYKAASARFKGIDDLCKLMTANAAAKQKRTVSRGLIAPDGQLRDGSQLKKEAFNNPTETEHFLIRYYQPGQK